MRFTRRSIGLLACAALAACGGSGGSEGGSDASFSGRFFYAALGGARLEVPPFSHMDAGNLVADGSGGATATAVLNNEDGTLGSLGVSPLTYTVGAGYAMTVSDTGGLLMTGGLASAGDVALGADLTANDYPLLMVLVKPVGTFSNASLTGDYHLCGVLTTASGAQTTVIQGVHFDGVGGMSNLPLPGYSNQSGVVTPLAAFPTVGTYVVAADGRVTVDGGAAMGHYTGALVAGGGFAILAGDTVAGFPPSLMVLVRVGAGLTNSAFNGRYWLAGISFLDATREHFACGSGEITADGAGTIPALTYTINNEGSIDTDTGTDDYGVGGNGTLMVGDIAGAGPYQRGAVSSDGRFAVLSGAIVAGEPPVLYVLVRK